MSNLGNQELGDIILGDEGDTMSTNNAYGQAQADIKQIGRGYAQAQADVKAIGNGFGQSQADIKSTSFGLGQSQGDIKAIGRGFAQAQADIKAIGNGFGQANAQILGPYQQFGQAQAKIKGLGTLSGQAQAWIAVVVVYDTFSRTTTIGNPYGTPDIGPDYITNAYTEYNFSNADGSNLVLTGNDLYDWLLAEQPTLITNPLVQIDFKYTGEIFPWATVFDLDLRADSQHFRDSVDGYYDPDDNVFRITFRVANPPTFDIYFYEDFPIPTPDIWYTFKYLAHGTDLYVKVWERGTQEPDWLFSTTNSRQIRAGSNYMYADVGEPVSAFPVEIRYDNYWVLRLDEQQSTYRSGQAQAFIQTFTKFKSGQAQLRAIVHNPYADLIYAASPAAYYPLSDLVPNGEGGSNVYDNVGVYHMTRAFGEFGYGPEGHQTGIPGTYGDYSMRNRSIANDSTSNFHYLHRYNGTIPLSSTTNWALEVWVNFITLGAGTTYLMTVGNTAHDGNGAFSIVYDANDAKIESRFGQGGGSESWSTPSAFTIALGTWYHVVLTRATGNLLLYINGVKVLDSSNTSIIHTPSNTIFFNDNENGGQNSAKFYFDEAAIYTREVTQTEAFSHYRAGILLGQRYAQAQAKIAPVRSSFGQAQGKINAFGVNGYGQSQAIINQAMRTGQAQAKLIGSPTRWGQAAADIKKFNNNNTGQARAKVISRRRATGQAQGYLRIISEGHGQTQALIYRPQAYGQALGTIIRTQGYGQAVAYILTWIKYGQAQARIKKLRNVKSGQAQALIEVSQQAFGNIFRDTFTRTTSVGVLGTPDVGSYVDTGPFGFYYAKSNADGSYLVTDEEFANEVFISANVASSDVIVSMDFMFTTVQFNTFMDLFVRTSSASPHRYVGAEIYNDFDIDSAVLNLFDFDGVTQALNLYLNVDLTEPLTWYTMILSVIGTEAKVKVWRRDIDPEPDWLITGTTTMMDSGIVTFGQYPGDDFDDSDPMYMDNLNVDGYSSIPPTGWGQAQGYIATNLHLMYGQALATILKGIKNGQAQGYIKTTGRTFGQTQGQIRKSAGYGQAQARVKDLPFFTNGNARAYIRKPQPSGQAQAKINAYGQRGIGQARARVLASVTYRVQGQSQAIIRGPAHGQAAARVIAPKYLIRYNGYDLPGYAQEETIDSVSRMKVNGVNYLDGSLTEYLGLENKKLSLRMKVVGESYIDVKLQAQKAATILRSTRGFTKLYVQYWDRYFEALTSKISEEKQVRSSPKNLEYAVEFETKPWLTSEAVYTVSGTGLISTDPVNRALIDGGWTPAIINVDGTDITISGYTATGDYAGFISISGAVSNFTIDSTLYTATDNGVMENANYIMYVGPAKTYFNISGATRCTITWRNRWYL